MRVDAICAVFIALVAFVSIPLSDSKLWSVNSCSRCFRVHFSVLNPGFVGLALTYALSLTGLFQYCVRQSAEVESLVCFHLRYQKI